jgi:hypothetical protein
MLTILPMERKGWECNRESELFVTVCRSSVRRQGRSCTVSCQGSKSTLVKVEIDEEPVSRGR